MREFVSQDCPLVWVTGANGLIGSHLLKLSGKMMPDARVEPVTRTQLDLTDFTTLEKTFHSQQPSLIVHCAAMSRSPDCQANPEKARLVNVEVTRVLAELAADIPFFFFSTDLIFDGRKGRYVETDEPNPLSAYAETKVEAEGIVTKNPKHTIIRTSLNAGPSMNGTRGFDEELLGALRAGKTLNLFTDEFRTPIGAAVTARAVWELVNQRVTGLYHVAGVERLSRWQMGELVTGRMPQFRQQINPSSLKSYQGAPRSPDTSLNCAKAQALLSFSLPRFSDWWRETSSANSEL